MPFTFGKSNRREPDLPGEWVGWLEPGVEVEGKMTVAAGLIRVNSHFKGQIQSQGMVVVHDQGEVEGEIHSRLISITGKVKGNIHAVERLEIKEHGVVIGDIDTPCLVVDPGVSSTASVACPHRSRLPELRQTRTPRTNPKPLRWPPQAQDYAHPVPVGGPVAYLSRLCNDSLLAPAAPPGGPKPHPAAHPSPNRLPTVASKSGSSGEVMEWRSGAIAAGASSLGILAPAIDRRRRGRGRAGTPRLRPVRPMSTCPVHCDRSLPPAQSSSVVCWESGTVISTVSSTGEFRVRHCGHSMGEHHCHLPVSSTDTLYYRTACPC